MLFVKFLPWGGAKKQRILINLGTIFFSRHGSHACFFVVVQRVLASVQFTSALSSSHLVSSQEGLIPVVNKLQDVFAAIGM